MARGLLRELLKDIIDEQIHNQHGFAGDTSIRVYIFQHLKYVYLVGLIALLDLLLFLVAYGGDTTLGGEMLFGLGLLLRWGLLGRDFFSLSSVVLSEEASFLLALGAMKDHNQG